MNEKRIKEMISDFARIYNSNLECPNHYYEWPKTFSGEESEIANKIYRYVVKKNSLTSTAIWRINSFLEKELLENVLSSLSNIPLHKA